MERDIPKSLKNRRLTEVIIGSQNIASSAVLNQIDDDGTTSGITDFSEMDDSYSTRSTQTLLKTSSLLKTSYQDNREGEAVDEKEIFENYSELWKYDQESFIKLGKIQRFHNFMGCQLLSDWKYMYVDSTEDGPQLPCRDARVLRQDR